MHIAETREQAYSDVEYGIEQWFRYFQKVAAFPQMAVEGGDVREMIDFVNESGHRGRRAPSRTRRRRSRGSSTSPAASGHAPARPTSGPTRRRPIAPTS